MGYSMDSSDSLLVMGASLIVLTPTPVDDGLVVGFYKVLDWVVSMLGNKG